MKDIHPKLTKCVFSCATCGAKFEVETTMNQSSYGIDICSKCHPFYIGKSSNITTNAKSSKLESKFNVGKENLNNKPSSKKAKERKINNVKGLSSL